MHSSVNRATALATDRKTCTSSVGLLIANNMSYVLFTTSGAVPNPASFVMLRILMVLSDDRLAKPGFSVLLAETFVDPGRFRVHSYKAGGWTNVGDSKEFLRHKDRYTNQPKHHNKFECERLAQGCP